MPEWITTTEAAKISGYTRKHVVRLLLSGKVNGQPFGVVWQVDRDSFLNYLKEIGERGAKRGPKTGKKQRPKQYKS